MNNVDFGKLFNVWVYFVSIIILIVWDFIFNVIVNVFFYFIVYD